MSERTPTTENIRNCYVYATEGYDGSLAIPERQSNAEFDRWLAAHDVEVRAEAESDPAKDERLVRYMAMVTPLGYQSALTVVQEMTKLIDAETRARADGANEPKRERTLGPDTNGIIYERTKSTATTPAGPWVPVKQEGESNG